MTAHHTSEHYTGHNDLIIAHIEVCNYFYDAMIGGLYIHHIALFSDADSESVIEDRTLYKILRKMGYSVKRKTDQIKIKDTWMAIEDFFYHVAKDSLIIKILQRWVQL